MGLRYGLEFGVSEGRDSLFAAVGFLLTAVHHVAKLLFVGWVMVGVFVLARESSATRLERFAIPTVAAAVGVTVAALSSHFQPFVAAQAIVAVPLAGLAIWRLLGIKESQRGLGASTLLLALAFMAFSYSIYWAGVLAADSSAVGMGVARRDPFLQRFCRCCAGGDAWGRYVIDSG